MNAIFVQSSLLTALQCSVDVMGATAFYWIVENKPKNPPFEGLLIYRKLKVKKRKKATMCNGILSHLASLIMTESQFMLSLFCANINLSLC